MEYTNITEAKAAYLKGENVMEHLTNHSSDATDRSQIIEIAYDLQAGSYVNNVKSNFKRYRKLCDEFAELLLPHLSSTKSILDVGTGEMTTLSLIMANRQIPSCSVYAFDLSWSRLWHGLKFWEDTIGSSRSAPMVFCADMGEIPLRSKSMDIVTSSHALEPNGNKLPEILKELFRVCREKLVLFEPSYELNSEEGKARMDKHGYIKGLESNVNQLGGIVHDIIPLSNVFTPLNPTTCYIIEPPADDTHADILDGVPFCAPGSDFRLEKSEGFYFAPEAGLVFPSLKGIPVLRREAGIIATSVCI